MNIEISKADLSKLQGKTALVAETLGAMANANRLQILCQLATGEKTVNQLVEAVDLAQSPMSQHLAKLRTLKLVRGRRDGKMVYYSIANKGVAEIMNVLYRVYCAPQV